MKIRIVQTEIEEAVRNYIESQIQVKDGHQITMEFTSTRGPEGLIADIDISPASGAATSTKPAAQTNTTPAGNTDTAAAQVTVRQEAATVTEDAAPARTLTRRPPAQATVTEDTAVVSTDASAPNQTAGDTEDKVDGDDDGTGPLKPSIFAGLRRPSNQAIEGDNA